MPVVRRYEMEVCYLEIYNEKIFDLLVSKPSTDDKVNLDIKVKKEQKQQQKQNCIFLTPHYN